MALHFPSRAGSSAGAEAGVAILSLPSAAGDSSSPGSSPGLSFLFVFPFAALLPPAVDLEVAFGLATNAGLAAVLGFFGSGLPPLSVS